MINEGQSRWVLMTFHELKLVSSAEVDAILSLFSDSFPFAKGFREADTLHVHGRVEDVSAMPHERIEAAGGRIENQRDGYIKYAFDGGINMIYSSIDISQDDLLGEHAGLPDRPFVDHVGIDLRQETAEIRSLFDAVPALATKLGWRHAAQGGDG